MRPPTLRVLVVALFLTFALIACGPTLAPTPTPTPEEQWEKDLQEGLGLLSGLFGFGVPALNPGQLVASLYWGFHDSLRWLELLIGAILFGLGFFGEVFRPPEYLDKAWVLTIILATLCLPYTAFVYFGLIAAAVIWEKLNIQIG
jgi:hypothetical protein